VDGGHARGIRMPSSPASSRAWTPPLGRSPGWRSTWTPGTPFPAAWPWTVAASACAGSRHMDAHTDRGDQSAPGPHGPAGGPAAGNHGGGGDRDGDGSRRGQQRRAGRRPGSRRKRRGLRPDVPAAASVARPTPHPPALILRPRPVAPRHRGGSIPGPLTCPQVVGTRKERRCRSNQGTLPVALALWAPLTGARWRAAALGPAPLQARAERREAIDLEVGAHPRRPPARRRPACPPGPTGGPGCRCRR
jgi:hypothetical protein